MDEIKKVGTMSLIENIADIEYLQTEEGGIAPLVFGDKMTSHAMTIPPGYYKPHSHPMELLIICIKGSCDIFQGDGSVRGTMKPFSVALVPADAEIGQEIKGPEDCEIIVAVAPRQMSREEFLARF